MERVRTPMVRRQTTQGVTTTVYPATRAETARLGSSIVNGAYLSGRRLSKSREGTSRVRHEGRIRGVSTTSCGRGTSPGAEGVDSPLLDHRPSKWDPGVLAEGI